MDKVLRVGACTGPKNIINEEGKFEVIKSSFLVLSLLLEPYDLYFEMPLEEIANGIEENKSKQSRLNVEGINKLIEFLEKCKAKMIPE